MRMGFTGCGRRTRCSSRRSSIRTRMMRSDYFGHLSRIPVASNWRAAGETLEWHAGWRLRPRFMVVAVDAFTRAPRRAALQPVQANRRRPHPRQLRTARGRPCGSPTSAASSGRDASDGSVAVRTRPSRVLRSPLRWPLSS